MFFLIIFEFSFEYLMGVIASHLFKRVKRCENFIVTSMVTDIERSFSGKNTTKYILLTYLQWAWRIHPLPNTFLSPILLLIKFTYKQTLKVNTTFFDTRNFTISLNFTKACKIIMIYYLASNKHIASVAKQQKHEADAVFC